MHRSLPRIPLAAALLLALPAAHATNDDPALSLLTTSFASPGARAAGMGGAFIGVADDSSAAFLNPAGLTLLANPELTVEFRARNAELQYLESFRNFRTSGDDSSTRELAYASFNYPLPEYDLAIAGFYGTLADAEFASSNARAPLQNSAFLPALTASISQRDRYAGLGVGWSPSALAGARVGLAIYFARRNLSAISRGEFDAGLTTDTDQQTGDGDVGFNLGFNYSFNENWSIGANYRSRLEYDLDITERETRSGQPGSVANYTASTVLPSSWAVGAAYRPTPQWVFALDVIGIQYSEQIDRSRAPIRADGTQLDGGTRGTRASLSADNGLDLRFGIEYLVESVPQLYLRGGVSSQSSGSIFFKDAEGGFSGFGAAIFPRGKRMTHFTLGIGLSAERLGVDVAIDRSSDRSEFVLSSYFSF